MTVGGISKSCGNVMVQIQKFLCCDVVCGTKFRELVRKESPPLPECL